MPAIRCLCASLLLVLTIGCTSTKTSNTARTGTEQLLISNAVDQALGKVDFSPMAGKKILVDEKYLDSVDKGYIISSIRHNVLHAGGHLTAKPEDADIILELRSGGVGTDISDAFLGIPGISLPGMVALPDLKLITRSRQSAFAKLGIVAIDAKTQQELPVGGVSLAMSDDNNWYVMGVGPYRQGTMEQEVEMSIGPGTGAIDGVIPAVVTFNRPGGANKTANGIPIANGSKNFKRTPSNIAPPRSIAKEPDTEESTGRIRLASGDDETPASQPAPDEQPSDRRRPSPVGPIDVPQTTTNESVAEQPSQIPVENPAADEKSLFE